MTHTNESGPPPRPPTHAFQLPQADSPEERVAIWKRWVEHEELLPEAVLDRALIKLLEQIRYTL
jgi:hypothetical protein